MRSGGFTLAVGVESSYGEAPPPEQMHVVGGSEFGTSFFIAEPIGAPAQSKFNFRVRRAAMNWEPSLLLLRLRLVSLSTRNVLAFLKVNNGGDAATTPFMMPVDLAVLDQAWTRTVGVPWINMDLLLDERHVEPATKEEILQALAATGEPAPDP